MIATLSNHAIGRGFSRRMGDGSHRALHRDLSALVHLVGIDDSVGALRRTGSHLSQFPANEVSGLGAIGVNPAVMRVDPLDLQGRVSCRLTRLHRCNCRLSMNGN